MEIIEKGLNGWDIWVFITLLKMWEDRGKPDDGWVVFRISELAQEMIRGQKDFSPRMYERIKRHIERVFGFTIIWSGHHFRLLSTCAFREKENDPDFLCGVQINDFVIRVFKSKDKKEITEIFDEWFREAMVISYAVTRTKTY